MLLSEADDGVHQDGEKVWDEPDHLFGLFQLSAGTEAELHTDAFIHRHLEPKCREGLPRG